MFRCFILFLVPMTAAAAEPVDFSRDIRPILSNHCFKCHGPGTQKAGLRLDTHEAAVKKAIKPGKSADSLLHQRITANDSGRMPPREIRKDLTESQISKLRNWIDQGATYSRHWAFISPKSPQLPDVKDAAWPKQPLDRFILLKLESKQIAPAVEADRAALIRRVSLDLLGLLPSPDEVKAFVGDKSPDAYEKLVDRLLASPHYGERQARHWLDLARYADSNGYTVDGRRSIWPWRDWVINTFNDDMPFDRFTREQLAGDLLPDATSDQLIATGFQRNTPVNEEGGTDSEQFRVERTVDRANTLGSVWLGLTVGCAQCHDHKYDPISQKEYYQLYAFFDATSEPVHKMATPEQEKHLADLNKKLADAKKAKTPAAELQALQKEIREFESAKVKSSLIVRDNPRTTNIHLRGDFLQKGDAVGKATPAALPSLAAKSPTRLDLANWLTSPEHPLTARVLVNRVWQQYFGKGIVETENDFGMQGRLPTHPELLDHLAIDFMKNGWSMKKLHRLIATSAVYRQASHHRSDLDEIDPDNALLARQNRLRLEAEIIRDAALTASGLLARTVGGPGVYPPQPKEVFSFTQSAKTWPESKGEDRYRRGMYTFIWRQSQHPLLTTFDGADAQVACTRRNRSNTPLQALHLANDPVFVELADALGKRILKEGPPDDIGRINFAFKLCFSREPQSAERERLLALREKYAQETPERAYAMLARVLLNLDEFITRE